MKKNFRILGIVLVTILSVPNFAFALITCPTGSHTFSGGTQASGYDMCIPDVEASGPVAGSSGSSGQSGATFTPSSKNTVASSGTTAQTQEQGIAIDTQVDSEVKRLYGTSIYAQAKALYDASIVTNRDDFNSVVNQVKNADYDTADSLKRAYNIRAIERLNQVWIEIMALETTYAEQQKKLIPLPHTITPTPINPTPIKPTPINATPIKPTPTKPTPIKATPVNPTTINPTDINPTDINPTMIAPSYSAPDLEPGRTFTTPDNQGATIVTPNQSIYLKAGSFIRYIDQFTWQTVNGTFRFLEKVAINSKFKIRTHGGASISVRGTQFLIDETDNITTVTVIKGTVVVTPTKGKAVTIKEGYQLIITAGVLGKATKYNSATIDTWYESAPAGNNFSEVAWQKTSSATNWSSECNITAGLATAAQTLTADEQAQLDYLNQKAIPVFRVHEINAFASPTKISMARAKTTINNGTKVMNAVVNGTLLYYSSDKSGKVWKVFQEKDLTKSMLQSAKSDNIVHGIDKSTIVFDHWDKSGATRVAVYKATATQEGTDSLIHNTFGPSTPSGSTLLSVNIYINEDTQQWLKTEASVNYLADNIFMPIYQTCKYTYDTTKVKVPKAKSITSKAGIDEMQKIYNTAQ
jgi:hypothetical protein